MRHTQSTTLLIEGVEGGLLLQQVGISCINAFYYTSITLTLKSYCKFTD